MTEKVDLGLVGGGSTAASFLAQFVKLLEQQESRLTLHIVVFEPAQELGIGEPYAPDLPTNLLNIPAGRMSAYAENRRDFFEWMHKQSKEYLASHGVTEFDAESYLPRPLFGDYLREVWQETVNTARRLGVTIEHRRAYVTDIQRTDQASGLIVRTSDGSVRADRVLLCNGNLPSTAYAGLRGVSRCFHSPYPADRVVAAIPKAARVGVIGTSLSAIDAIVSLKESGHQGAIYAVSRSGRLPAVRSTVLPPCLIEPPTVEQIRASVSDPSFGLTLEDMFAFLCRRVQDAGGEIDLTDILGCGSDTGASLDREIDASSKSTRLWQGVAISLNETIEHAWKLMPDSERRRLYSDWRATWMIRRATFPMDNAVRIRRYLNEGGLHILTGGPEMSITQAGESGFTIRAQGSGQGAVSAHVQYLINATGMSTDVSRTDDALVTSLLQKGMAVADPYGGFKLDFDTSSLIDSNGNIQCDITVLGSLCVGTYFWTMSLDVNARLALEQAQNLIKEMTVAVAAA